MRGNSIALQGNIYPKGRDDNDLELRFSPSGVAVINFNLSCYTHKDNDVNQYTSYRCVAFGELAEHIAESLAKGDNVIAFGRIQANNWETKEGDKRYDQEVIIDELGPSLRWGLATVQRTERQDRGSGGASQPKARDSYGPDEAPF